MIFDQLDMQGNGGISLAEFHAAALTQRRQLLDSLLRPVFKHFDLTQNGKMSSGEVLSVLRDLGAGGGVTEAKVQEMIAEFDTTESGDLSFNEFCIMMSSSKMSPIDLVAEPSATSVSA